MSVPTHILIAIILCDEYHARILYTTATGIKISSNGEKIRADLDFSYIEIRE